MQGIIHLSDISALVRFISLSTLSHLRIQIVVSIIPFEILLPTFHKNPFCPTAKVIQGQRSPHLVYRIPTVGDCFQGLWFCYFCLTSVHASMKGATFVFNCTIKSSWVCWLYVLIIVSSSCPHVLGLVALSKI